MAVQTQPSDAVQEHGKQHQEQLHVGVLALQGAFEEHANLLRSLGAKVTEVRLPGDFAGLDAIVLPGGESTAMALIGERWGVFPQLREWVATGRPVWGTCAGMILLSNEALMQKEGGQALVGGLDVEICRNYFGSQISSFEQPIDTTLLGLTKEECAGTDVEKPYPAVFIRAPAILSVAGEGVSILAKVRALPCSKARLALEASLNAPAASPERSAKRQRLEPYLTPSEELPEVIVAAKKDNILVTAFHPELTADKRWHAYFLKMVREAQTKT
ncbi:class I glutamine amidotransferase-like protein [Tribonema minus]|uniref:glutaminase n=1 Tax=Tribonema minus TaxID=303371 RepID=A0A835YX69_9STRA|nr:class I glutamine amidotransferase-like protein [Tribonema minus]